MWRRVVPAETSRTSQAGIEVRLECPTTLVNGWWAPEVGQGKVSLSQRGRACAHVSRDDRDKR